MGRGFTNNADVPLVELIPALCLHQYQRKCWRFLALPRVESMNRFAEGQVIFMVVMKPQPPVLIVDLRTKSYRFRHRFVNDVQISIGAAHSGYPVQSSSYNKNSSSIPTNGDDDYSYGMKWVTT